MITGDKMTQETQQIALTLIYARQNNREFDDATMERIKGLSEDIKANGLLQPIGVEPDGNGRYTLIWGERRFRAAKLAGLATITAIVKVGLSRKQSLMATVKENDNREQTNAIEQAKGYKALLDLGATVKEIAGEIGHTQRFVQDRLNLLELRPDVQKYVADGALGIAYANCMLGLDTNRQRMALETYNSQDAIKSVKWFQQVCGNLLAQQAQDSLFTWGYGDSPAGAAAPAAPKMPDDPSNYRPSFDPSNMRQSVMVELERWQAAGEGWRTYGKGNKVEACTAIVATLAALLAALPAGGGVASVPVLQVADSGTAGRVVKLLAERGEMTRRELLHYGNCTAEELTTVLAGLQREERVAGRKSGRGQRWMLTAVN